MISLRIPYLSFIKHRCKVLKHERLQGDERQETIKTSRGMQAKTNEALASVDIGH
jgi:hypothetical protein